MSGKMRLEHIVGCRWDPILYRKSDIVRSTVTTQIDGK